jgi:diphthine-ammonia ligase
MTLYSRGTDFRSGQHLTFSRFYYALVFLPDRYAAQIYLLLQRPIGTTAVQVGWLDSLTMSKPLNVIALISGGKDSLYTLLHCIQNGHKVVALANLCPALPEDAAPDAREVEDMNSFMYQTVGHSVIPLYADVLQLPLYRQQIRGTSNQTGRYYDSSLAEGALDETEDLVPLLNDVVKHHPEANSICSGAILSTYQRTRIESVALRLGLVPLAYLWQYPFLSAPPSRRDSLTGLLEDMCSVGCDSRIIKIASGGMPDDLLWTNVTQPQSMRHIVDSMAPFFENDEPGLRGAVLGEGGEFETLALNGPRQVWVSKIDIAAEDNSVVSEEAGVKWLRVGRAKVIERDTDTDARATVDLVPVPSALDPQFKQIVERGLPITAASNANGSSAKSSYSSRSLKQTYKFSRESNTINIANLTSHELPADAAQQTEHIIADVRRILLEISKAGNLGSPLYSDSIVSTTILLASMASFPSVNTSYSKLFSPGLPNPPARVTVACYLPPGVQVSFSFTISLLPRSTHRGLHVQSRSYWAPANIGPYSQAISVVIDGQDERDQCEFAYVAGQIPLVPATMEILQAPFPDQAVLALQHLWRVGQERGVDLWMWGIAFLPRLDDAEQSGRPCIAAEVWRQAHMTTVHGKLVMQGTSDNEEEDGDNENGPDAWDLKHNRGRAGRVVPTVGQHRHVLPNSAVVKTPLKRPYVPPSVIAEVEELPRAAPIEWHSHGLGGLAKISGVTPRVFAASYRYGWGSLSICTYRRPASESKEQEHSHEADEQEFKNDTGPEIEHHFVTFQIFESATTSEKKVPKVLELAASHLHHSWASLEMDETKNTQAVIHGTAYLSGSLGEETLAAVAGLEAIPGLIIIPSCELWGDCDTRDVSDVPRAGLAKLSLALTLRIDTF